MKSWEIQISWKQLSPIFADVVLSPWNLLVGGLLIKYLSPLNAFLSVVIGYSILALVFILYGGLGFKKRKQSAEIFHEVFQGRFSSVFIPMLLALGQLGWAAINISLGGSSLASLVGLPRPLGFILYSLIVGGMAAAGLYKLAYAKVVVIISAMSLAVYIGVLKLQAGDFAHFFTYQPSSQKTLYWGCSVVVASLISFATVSPDFFKNLKHKRDIKNSTFLGIFIPGALMCYLGCLFFYDAQLNLATLLASLSFAALPNAFNTVANTDGSMALYTPALKFQYVFKWRFIDGVIFGTVMSLIVALAGITNHIEAWLKVLTTISPVFIGVAFAAVLFDKKFFSALPKYFSRYAYWCTMVLCVVLLDHTVPVIIALIAPLIIYGVYLQYKLIHQ